MKKILLLLTAMFLSLSAVSLDEKIDYLDNVKELVTLTQKMRGDTNVYIKGGHVVVSDIEDDRDNVAISLRDLHRKFDTVDVSIDDEFAQLNLYMQSLNDVASELDNMITFRAYTLLIKEMLTLGGKVQKNFFMNDTDQHKRAAAVMMNDILPMTDHIGVLRGLGSGISSSELSNEDENTCIKDHISSTLDTLDNLILKMSVLRSSYPKSYPKNLDAQLEKYRQDVKHYVQFVEEKLLESENGKEENKRVDSYDFFSQGSSLINKTLHYYEMNKIVLKK